MSDEKQNAGASGRFEGQDLSGTLEKSQQHTVEGQAYGAETILETIDRRMCDLEKQLTKALASTNGACMSDAATAIDSAVRRAQTKGKMFGDRIICVPELVMAALDEIDADIANLPKVTEMNASIMQGVQQAEGSGGGSESMKTARGSRTASGYNEGEKKARGSNLQKGSTEGEHNSEDAGLTPRFQSMSVVSQSEGEADNGTNSNSGAGSTTSCDPAAVAASASKLMEPLWSLVEEAKQSLKVPKVVDARKAIPLRKADSRELRIAQSVDFDRCESPQNDLSIINKPKRGNGSPTSSTSSPRVFGHCIAYGIDAAGNPVRVEPRAAHVDQYKPMLSPREPPSNNRLSKSGLCESAVPPGLYTGAFVSGKEDEDIEDSTRPSGFEFLHNSCASGVEGGVYNGMQNADVRVPQEMLGPGSNHNAILVEKGL